MAKRCRQIIDSQLNEVKCDYMITGVLHPPQKDYMNANAVARGTIRIPVVKFISFKTGIIEKLLS